MQHLSMPATAAEDEAVVRKLAKKAEWKPHETDWLTAYQTYRANSGSPFAVNAHDFGPGVGKRQYDLYDSRKGSGDLKRMRQKAGLKSCPVCGSPVTGDLDHYLPRDMYREFSIMRANLVPACRHCNSGVKGTTVHGGNPRRFIHPYFDTWAADALWDVEIVPPYNAATFRPRVMAGLPAPRDQIVAFHLDNVLGTQFHLSMATDWSTLPGQIKLRDPILSLQSVTDQIGLELRVALMSRGVNSWQAALMRGILAEPAAIAHLLQEAIVALLP
ncbi:MULTISPECIES: HNH endonuclease [Novosphingobium]|jgi:hypothetical protein|uniref:HNH nuclease domain-containing protein n=2 Tax=Novosphingobium resinovorum TaxID=158500 RepID=A0A031JWJ1_9SPHN|nr:MULTISPECIES: HNH endonuclease [Novosphingobium]EZP81285.1 hypothetical protein BV97_02946 [Novosphingobium resinovorum]